MSISILRARFLKLNRFVKTENRYGHGRTGRIGCTGLVLVNPALSAMNASCCERGLL